MKKSINKIVVNRTSPRNEQDYINAYKQVNPKSKKEDHMDIAAVKTKEGNAGHALLNQNINRGKDNKPHIGKAFVSDSELRKVIKSKK